MRFGKTTLYMSCLAAMMTAPVSQAEIKFNGFASVYGGIVTEGDNLFGYTDEVDFKPETKFALQAKADLTQGLTATVQIVSRGSDDFETEFEWAYLTYEISDDLSVSAGRLRLPFFKASEYLEVGYAYPYARLPQDVYLIDFNTAELIRFDYTKTLGDWDTRWQFGYGSLDDELMIASGEVVPTTFDNLFTFSAEAEYNWLMLRASYSFTDVTSEIPGLFDRALEPLFTDIGDFEDINFEDDYGYFASVGVFMEFESWFAHSEFVQTGAPDSVQGVADRYYISAGYRRGDFTYYGVYGGFENDRDLAPAQSISEQIPTLNDACGANARQFVENCVLNVNDDYNTWSVGARWDFHPRASFTLDFTSRKYDKRQSIDVDITESLLSFGVDVIF